MVQQKVDARTSWFAAVPRRWCGCGIQTGVVPPAYLSRKKRSALLRLAEFVIDRATEDWRYLFERQKATGYLDQPAGLLSQIDRLRCAILAATGASEIRRTAYRDQKCEVIPIWIC